MSVMNTIPSIFNEFPIKRTVLGAERATSFGAKGVGVSLSKPDSAAKVPVTLVMLNDTKDEYLMPVVPSHLRTQAIDSLLACGFERIVWIAPLSSGRNTEELAKKYPSIRFVIPQEECTTGELINTAVSELESDYFLVLKDIIHVSQNILPPNVALNLIKQGVYCTVPRLLNDNGNQIIMNNFPEVVKGRFRISGASYIADGLPTLYPVDFIGLYNREKFILLGGFDRTIKSPYWQNVDMGLRAHLWGEEVKITTQVTFTYEQTKSVDDVTRDYSYLYFYLKNILPIFKEDHAIVKTSSFLSTAIQTGCGIFEAKRLVKVAKDWVSLNKFRFKRDIKDLVENWNK